MQRHRQNSRSMLSHSQSERKPIMLDQIKTELTPNVIANSKREYRQFELAYKKSQRNSSYEKKSSQ